MDCGYSRIDSSDLLLSYYPIRDKTILCPITYAQQRAKIKITYASRYPADDASTPLNKIDFKSVRSLKGS